MTYTVFYRHRLAMPFAPAPETVNRSDYRLVATVEANDLEHLFRVMNVVEGDELPVTLGIRSMSVGDVAYCHATSEAHYCAAMGWTPVQLEGEG